MLVGPHAPGDAVHDDADLVSLHRVTLASAGTIQLNHE
jgi:hypothetical protein